MHVLMADAFFAVFIRFGLLNLFWRLTSFPPMFVTEMRNAD